MQWRLSLEGKLIVGANLDCKYSDGVYFNVMVLLLLSWDQTHQVVQIQRDKAQTTPIQPILIRKV